MCAKGHRAEEWVCEHHIDETPFGPHSPFAKLSEQDGLVVGLGVLPENCLTHVHVFEDRMGKNFPFSLYEENLFQVSMIDHSGVLSVFRTPLHNTLSGTRDIRILTRALAKSNAVTYRNFFNAPCFGIRARKVDETLETLYRSGMTLYGGWSGRSVEKREGM